MTFKVKAGVLLPARKKANNGSQERVRYPFDSLEVNQSFFVPDRTTKQLASYTSLRGRELNKKFQTQTIYMRQDLQTDEWEPCKSTAVGARKGVAVTRRL